MRRITVAAELRSRVDTEKGFVCWPVGVSCESGQEVDRVFIPAGRFVTLGCFLHPAAGTVFL